MSMASSRYLALSEERSEQDLLALARAKDESAVRAIVRRHNQRLFRIARGVMQDDAEAEDIVQETYVRAFTHLDSFRGESSLASWLIRIALNEAFGRLRRRRPTTDIAELDLGSRGEDGRLIMFPTPPAAPNPEAEAARRQVRLVLERAVDGLPEPFRLVFLLREIEGLSTEETAVQLAIRAETVKTRLFRARRLLRTAVEEALTASFAELFPFGGARCLRMAEAVVERLARSCGSHRTR